MYLSVRKQLENKIFRSVENMDKILKHTITIGLNDKDTKKEKWYYKLLPFLATKRIENILYKQGIERIYND